MPVTHPSSTVSSPAYGKLSVNGKFAKSLAVGLAYRYGFNSQEKDDEIYGTGNSYTAEYWQYDARLGRRWNLDPVVKPWESGYAALSCSPIVFVDPNGDADYYTASGKWIGTDGKNDNEIFVVCDRKLIKDVKNTSKQGNYYEVDIQSDRSVLRIPPQNVREKAIEQYKETYKNGYETGGHSHGSEVTIWDIGTRLQQISETISAAGIIPFLVNGQNGLPKFDELDFYWHSHPQSSNPTPGPSDITIDSKTGKRYKGDIGYHGDILGWGYKTNAFVMDSGKVFYYDEKGVRGSSMNLFRFLGMGSDKRGKTYKQFKKMGGDIYDIVPDASQDLT